MTSFAELSVITNFSFLRGGSHPEDLVKEAERLGLAGIAVTDRNTLAGVVRGHVMAQETGFPYAVGCRLSFRDGTPDIAVGAPCLVINRYTWRSARTITAVRLLYPGDSHRLVARFKGG